MWAGSIFLAGLLLVVSTARESENATSAIRIKRFKGKVTEESLLPGTVDVYEKELNVTSALDLLRISAEVLDPEDFKQYETPILQVAASNGRDQFLLKLPVIYPNLTLYSYGKVLNHLMPGDFGNRKKKNNNQKPQNLVVTVQSRLHVDIKYKLTVESLDRSQYNLKFKAGESKKTLNNQHLTFVKPIGFYLDSEEQDVHSFRIQVTSGDDICAKLITIPADEAIYDRKVDSDEVDNRRSMTFSKRADVFFTEAEIKQFKQFRIFVLINPDDLACSSNSSRKSVYQKKMITFEFQKMEPQSYYIPILAMIGFLLTPALILIPPTVLKSKPVAIQQQDSHLISFSTNNSPIPSEYIAESQAEPSRSIENQPEDSLSLEDALNTEDAPSSEANVSVVPPPDSLSLHGNMFRFPAAVILPILMHTSLEYHNWTTSTMANRDEMCFHNHACALPYGDLLAWNNVVSNIGYAMYGCAFIVITMRRRSRLHRTYGFGTYECALFDVSIGVFMVLQAIASATYHICPSDVAFQFDTPCIQVICGLLILRQWLVRLESPSAAYSNILLVVVFSLNFLISAFSKTPAIRTFIACFHCFAVAAVCLAKKRLLSRHGDERSHKRASYVFILIFSTANFAMMVLYTASSLLHLNQITTYIFILNCILYLAYYALMKAMWQERLGPIAKLCGLLALVGWLIAAFFFFFDETDWTKNAAASRALNKPCLLLNFFGSHDLWHICGALAGLFTFLFVSYVDDDLLNVPTTSIQPF